MQCSSLRSISIPSSVESIGSFCFDSDQRLRLIEVAADSRLSILGDGLFRGCGYLRSLFIPASVRQLTGVTFVSSWIRSIDVDEANSVFEIDGDFVVNLEENSIVWYFGTENEIVIESGFSGIAAGGFHGPRPISTIQFEMGSRVAFFGAAAFGSCTALQSFSIPATVEAIPDRCFENCHELAKVTFESVSRVSGLGDRAFANCSSLAAICIPAGVTRIGIECFSRCSKLATVTVDIGIRLSGIGKRAFHGCSSSLQLPAALADYL
jgi:hypothetical protein